MSSSEKDRTVWQNLGEQRDDDYLPGLWLYTDENNVTHGPFYTEKEATEKMRLHGLEE